MKNGSHLFNCTLLASKNKIIFELKSICKQAFFKSRLF